MCTLGSVSLSTCVCGSSMRGWLEVSGMRPCDRGAIRRVELAEKGELGMERLVHGGGSRSPRAVRGRRPASEARPARWLKKWLEICRSIGECVVHVHIFLWRSLRCRRWQAESSSAEKNPGASGRRRASLLRPVSSSRPCVPVCALEAVAKPAPGPAGDATAYRARGGGLRSNA